MNVAKKQLPAGFVGEFQKATARVNELNQQLEVAAADNDVALAQKLENEQRDALDVWGKLEKQLEAAGVPPRARLALIAQGGQQLKQLHSTQRGGGRSKKRKRRKQSRRKGSRRFKKKRLKRKRQRSRKRRRSQK